MPKEIARVGSTQLKSIKSIPLIDGVFMEISYVRSGVYLQIYTCKTRLDIIRIHSVELPKKLQNDLGLKSCRIFQARGKIRIHRFIFDNVINTGSAIQIHLDVRPRPVNQIQIVKRRRFTRTNKIFSFA